MGHQGEWMVGSGCVTSRCVLEIMCLHYYFNISHRNKTNAKLVILDDYFRIEPNLKGQFILQNFLKIYFLIYF